MMDLAVLPADPGRLEDLVAALGQREYFTDRFTRQNCGKGVVLLAWLEGQVVGDVFLWCASADEPEVRAHLPGVPLLNHLEVLPDHRGRGIGTAIIATAEATARKIGYAQIALGVGLDNLSAYRLYASLGYANWGYGPIQTGYEKVLPDGTKRHVAETVDMLVKTLRPGGTQTRFGEVGATVASCHSDGLPLSPTIALRGRIVTGSPTRPA